MADTPPKRNPALRLLGLPGLPQKLPSRNWLIFWGLSSALTAAIVYDRREKKRATARWVAAVAPLAHEPLPSASAMPRRVTVFLAAPPGDGLRVAQDHFAEYAKPVLAASGLDWDFVVGRRQGDVRAVVAERVRRERRSGEGDPSSPGDPRDPRDPQDPPTADDVVQDIRRRNGIPEYAGMRGDLVFGRHTWKEYVRGLHEGWLGPLTAPAAAAAAAVEPASTPAPAPAPAPAPTDKKDLPPADPAQAPAEAPAETPAPAPEAPATPPADKPKKPEQPPPYNAVDDYPASPLPRGLPAELGPSAPLPFPHLLGFLNTPTRLARFLQRRRLADEIGRDVAAVCFGTARAFRVDADAQPPYEQQAVLAHEEKDWVKSVWKTDEKKDEKDDDAAVTPPPPERVWAAPVVVDPRIGERMRRFQLTPEAEAAARQIVVPEEQIEGWTKGKLRLLGRWAARKWTGADRLQVNVGNLDDDA